MRRVFGEIRIWLKFLQLVLNPYDTLKVFELIDLILKYRDRGYFRPMREKVFSSPDFQSQFNSGWLPSFPTMEQLAAMPEGSLGRVFHAHLLANKLNLNFFPLLDCSEPVKYIVYRAYLVHDLTHVVLDYGTSIPEELAIQSFTVAQANSPISTMILAAGLLFLATREPAKVWESLRLISEGYERGVRSRQILEVPFDEFLPLPLEEARLKFGVVPRGSAAA